MSRFKIRHARFKTPIFSTFDNLYSTQYGPKTTKDDPSPTVLGPSAAKDGLNTTKDGLTKALDGLTKTINGPSFSIYRCTSKQSPVRPGGMGRQHRRHQPPASNISGAARISAISIGPVDSFTTNRINRALVREPR